MTAPLPELLGFTPIVPNFLPFAEQRGFPLVSTKLSKPLRFGIMPSRWLRVNETDKATITDICHPDDYSYTLGNDGGLEFPRMDGHLKVPSARLGGGRKMHRKFLSLQCPPPNSKRLLQMFA
jgi:hypothetical protein